MTTGVIVAAERLADELLFPAALATDRSDVVPVELLDALAAGVSTASPARPRPAASRPTSLPSVR